MTLFQAFFLGIVQGLTEFIPVSSTAHLLIVANLLGLAEDERTFAFSVIIQLGTVFALLVFFWRDFYGITMAFLHSVQRHKPFDDFQSRLGLLVIVATIPALIAGFLLKDILNTIFTDTLVQGGVRLLFTAVLLVIAEYFDKRTRTLQSATWVDALSVGLFQVLALFPGASRSGTTIVGGMVRGFDRPSAARFAFLMSAPILIAAGAYESLKVIEMSGTRAFLPYLGMGFVTAAVVGWLTIKWLIAYLGKHSLYIFAAYCAIAGLVVLFL